MVAERSRVEAFGYVVAVRHGMESPGFYPGLSTVTTLWCGMAAPLERPVFTSGGKRSLVALENPADSRHGTSLDTPASQCSTQCSTTLFVSTIQGIQSTVDNS